MDEIKISVIIPVYNNETTIVRCIESVINQTLDGIEIIVIDDGSTDNSYNIVSEYSNKYSNLRVVKSKHQGQGLSRNIGLQMAKGEYIGFVDGDDAISDVMYERLYQKIGDADICQCNAWVVQSHNEHKAELKRFEGEIEVKDRVKYMNEFFFTYIHSHGCCNKIYRKSFLDVNNIQFADNAKVHSEDLYFNILAVKKLNKIVFVDEMLYYYYQYKDSHSRSFSIEKVRKLCSLFDMVTNDEFKYILARLGVMNICINLTEFNCNYSEILSRKDFRRLIKLSLKAPEAFYQRIVLISLLVFKGKIRIWIIKKYYGRFRRENEK